MRVFRMAALAAVLSYFPAEAFGQCDCGPGCPLVRINNAPEMHWTQDSEERSWFGLFVNRKQVIAYNARSCRIHLLDPVSGQWIESKPEMIEQVNAEAGREPVNNGMNRRLIRPDGERWELNGRAIAPEHGKAVLRGDGKIPDDSETPSLTLIGSEKDCSDVLGMLATNKDLADLAGRFLVQSYRPDNPMIAKAGFVLDGKPTIYGQLPDGRDLFRLDGNPGPELLKPVLQRALQAVDGLRKPDPAYKPGDDPGLTIKPQVDATIQTPPWMMVLTHLLALVVGAGGALGGRWAVVAALASVVESALEARLKQKPPSGTAPGNPAPPASQPSS